MYVLYLYFFYVLKAVKGQQCDRNLLLTSWIFFSVFFFLVVLIGKELTLVRVIWLRDDFFTRWRLIPGLSSNRWPTHQVKTELVSQSATLYEIILPAVVPSLKDSVLLTEHLNKSYNMFSMSDAFFYMAASSSPVNRVSRCLMIYVRKLTILTSLPFNLPDIASHILHLLTYRGKKEKNPDRVRLAY